MEGERGGEGLGCLPEPCWCHHDHLGRLTSACLSPRASCSAPSRPWGCRGCASDRLTAGMRRRVNGCTCAHLAHWPCAPPPNCSQAPSSPSPPLAPHWSGRSFPASPVSRQACPLLGPGRSPGPLAPPAHVLEPSPPPSPRDEHRCVMVGHTVLRNGVAMAAAVHDGFLPLTEAVQGLPGVVGDLQGGLRADRVRCMGASCAGGGGQAALVCRGGGVRGPRTWSSVSRMRRVTRILTMFPRLESWKSLAT